MSRKPRSSHTTLRTLLLASSVIAGALGCGSQSDAPRSTPPSGATEAPQIEPSGDERAGEEVTAQAPSGEAQGEAQGETAPRAPAEPAVTTELRSAQPASDTRTLAQLVAANNQFTTELYVRVVSAHENAAMSPYSVHTAFAMTREGARGTTEAELSAALHLRGDVTPAVRALADRVAAIGASGVELRTANRVFIEGDVPVESAFRASLDAGFRAPFEALSFADPEAARAHINGWVSGQTNQRIDDLLPAGALSAGTKLVLTNAVYFHGTWLRAFDRDTTSDEPFHVDGGAGVSVPMMRATQAVRFARLPDLRAVELPYTGGQIAMVLVVPEAVDGLPALLGGLDAARLDAIVTALGPVPRVEIAMPRFRIDGATVTLSEAMQRLGVRQAFDDHNADFSGIARLTPPLYISEGFHQAFVEVNEEGTEAAAATAVVMGARGIAPPRERVERITADRPFLFFLRDTRSGAVLFVGHVVDPR